MALACGSAEERLDGAAVERGSASVPASALSQGAEADVVYRDGRVRLHVDAASNLAVLARLADLAGFSVLADGVVPRPVSLRLDDVGLGDAVPALLPGERLSLDYEWDSEIDAQRLTRVFVGGSVATLAARLGDLGMSDRKKSFGEAYARKQAKQAQKDARDAERLAQREALLSPKGQAREQARREKVRLAIEAREREEAEAQAIRMEHLRSTDPALRIGAVEDFEIEGSRYDPLLDLLATDPDQSVRVAALERLQGENDLAVSCAILDALDDPHPRVILAALDGLRSNGDASIVRNLDPLLSHDDPEVRAAASQTIDYLE